MKKGIQSIKKWENRFFHPRRNRLTSFPIWLKMVKTMEQLFRVNENLDLNKKDIKAV